MPRKSAASLLMITSPEGHPIRVHPPTTLGKAERALFIRLVAASDPRHFLPSDLPLLCQYCEVVTLAERAAQELRNGGAIAPNGRASAWLGIQEKAIKAMTTLSLRLRLSPQARVSNLVRRAQPTGPVSAYELLELAARGNGED